MIYRCLVINADVPLPVMKFFSYIWMLDVISQCSTSVVPSAFTTLDSGIMMVLTLPYDGLYGKSQIRRTRTVLPWCLAFAVTGCPSFVGSLTGMEQLVIFAPILLLKSFLRCAYGHQASIDYIARER